MHDRPFSDLSADRSLDPRRLVAYDGGTLMDSADHTQSRVSYYRVAAR